MIMSLNRKSTVGDLKEYLNDILENMNEYDNDMNEIDYGYMERCIRKKYS